MNGIYRLHFSFFLKHPYQIYSKLVVICGDKGLTLLSDKFQVSVVVGAAQHRNIVNLGRMNALIVIEESVNNITIAVKYFFCRSAEIIRPKNDYRIFHRKNYF